MSEDRSSEFVQWGVLILFGILGIVARIYHFPVLSAALLMLFLLCTLSRLWSDHALKDVHIQVTSEPAALFPGGEVEQTIRIRNDKLLPLLWLEVRREGGRREILAPTEVSDTDTLRYQSASTSGEALTPDAQRHWSASTPEEALAPDAQRHWSTSTSEGASAPDAQSHWSTSTPEGASAPDAQRQGSATEPGENRIAHGLQRRFTFVMGHEEITWSNRWKALRRGIFRPGELRLRSGDAFGLAMTERTDDSAETGTVVVYPALQPVSSDLFLQNMWESSGGGGGYLEDPSLTRSTRDYTPTDSIRNINWRLTARTRRTIVNIRETILPRSAFFVLDCGSFPGAEEAFEDTLSILTSLIRRLDESGIVCGAALPAGMTSAACVLYNRETTPLRDILYAFACYELPERPGAAGAVGSAGAAGTAGTVGSAGTAGTVGSAGAAGTAGTAGSGGSSSLSDADSGSPSAPSGTDSADSSGASAAAPQTVSSTRRALPAEQLLSLPYTGRFCYICLSTDSITDHELLQRLDPGRTTIMPYRGGSLTRISAGAAASGPGRPLPVMQTLELTRLKKKGGLS